MTRRTEKFVYSPVGDLAKNLGGLGKAESVCAVSVRLCPESFAALKEAKCILSETTGQYVLAASVHREALKAFARMLREKKAQAEQQQDSE
jgi:hypothetical protein